ncbi:MAG: DNA-binding protein [Candidatus Komeilibacteria bacterium RIFCSPLOWO2_01_FULL_45_10]|uniref:DNA-binding protein n=1 Tax=Candidatus Komeilibacteria bacterium RIFCSPLOWO2_01_FULL_45_10 TaxID=1798550 RepID=A0A1G2BM22_9BACT|nr:MAG: DNA-binding protein [Candidatus Komeilibacteria bacterium RIFCSPLOWO2_01_FULL_45_10]
MRQLIPNERIISRIFYIRGRKVMFDRDLAELYGVETRSLNQAVSRNKARFPDDFMFQLTEDEMQNWISQIVISNREKMGLRRRSYVFTEQGVAMLSSVLKSQRAVQVNIAIMRTFVKLREILLTHKELREKIEKMEKKYDEKFRVVFDVIKKLIIQEEKPFGSAQGGPKTEIGFKVQ